MPLGFKELFVLTILIVFMNWLGFKNKNFERNLPEKKKKKETLVCKEKSILFLGEKAKDFLDPSNLLTFQQ